jgi:hypothetical protein
MAQFVEPPIFQVPRGPSLGVNIARGVQSLMAELDSQEEKRKQREREAIAASIEGENRLLELAPLLSEFEPAPPTRLTEPAQPELGLSERPGPSVQLGESRIAPPLLTELTLPSGRKVPIPPIRGSRERMEAAEAAKAQEGTEVVTPEIWDKLPDFYKSRWQPGQRVSTEDIGAVGMQILENARGRVSQPSTKSVYDRVAKQDVLRTEEQISQDPSRYGPPQEARISSAEDRKARAAEAAAAKATAATEKKTAEDQAIQDAADRIAAGEPAANVSGRYRDAATRIARERGARVYTTQPQKDKVVTLDSIKKDVDRLTELLQDPKIAMYFGVMAGPVTALAQRVPEIPIVGPHIPPEVHEARSLMLNLQDRVLRQRSGAQINQAEMKRVTQFSPDPGHRLSKTLVNLAKMGAEIDDLISGQLGAPSASKGGPSAIKPGSKIGRFTVVGVE